MLKEKGLSTAVGDEGGFAPDGISSPAEAMKLLNEAIQRAGHADGQCAGSTQVRVGLAVAQENVAAGLLRGGFPAVDCHERAVRFSD